MSVQDLGGIGEFISSVADWLYRRSGACTKSRYLPGTTAGRMSGGRIQVGKSTQPNLSTRLNETDDFPGNKIFLNDARLLKDREVANNDPAHCK